MAVAAGPAQLLTPCGRVPCVLAPCPCQGMPLARPPANALGPGGIGNRSDAVFSAAWAVSLIIAAFPPAQESCAGGPGSRWSVGMTAKDWPALLPGAGITGAGRVLRVRGAGGIHRPPTAASA
jgi:hypothetical protein